MRPIALLTLSLLLPNPGVADAPLFSIDRDRAAAHAEVLAPGHRALLDALPEGFRIDVHATTEVAAEVASGNPARLDADGRISAIGSGLPFPVIEPGDPDGGLKAIWNHRLRLRGSGRERATWQASIAADGSVRRVDVRQRLRLPADPQGEDRVAQHALAIVAPARLAGSLKLLDEPLAGPMQGWQRSPGPWLPSLRATTDAGADTPLIGSDGLFVEDQRDGFAGSPDRWRWKLVARRRLVMPWNAQALQVGDAGDVATLLRPHHPDPARLRHELRDVWVVDADLKPGESSPWPSRRYYLDAATWQVLLVELQGPDGRLARLHEVHVRVIGTHWVPVVDVVHDLPGRRWFIAGIETGDGGTVPGDWPAEAFALGPVRRWAKSVGDRASGRR